MAVPTVSNYRPITDCWMLARSKVSYYGAYPAGFLDRARALLGVGIHDPVLHVCGGKVRDYPFRGFGPYDRTLDLSPACRPDFYHDAREPFPMPGDLPKRKRVPHTPGYWPAILADPPYTEDDADHYTPGAGKLPTARRILINGLHAVATGGRVGILHYVAPRPPKEVHGSPIKFVACVTVFVGFENRPRLYSVYEKLSPVEAARSTGDEDEEG